MPSARTANRQSTSKRTSKSSRRAGSQGQAAEARPAPLSRQRKPPAMPADDWQRGLRQQFGAAQDFTLENLGSEPVYSDFRIGNPQSGRHYTVSVRGPLAGDQRCTCADYASNDLGTCKHIEFTLARLRARRGGKTALKQAPALPFSEIVLQAGPQRALRWLPGAGCPDALRRAAARVFEADVQGRQLLPAHRLEAFERFLQQLPAAGDGSHPVHVDAAARAHVAELRDALQRRSVLAEAYPRGARDKALAKLLKTRLYPYQAEGALFAAAAGRALLADEMGLGKTVQALATAELMARHFGVQRVLVVCPSSLKHQWQRELQRFTGRDARVLQGPRAQRQQQYGEEVFCKIANYETIARDLDLIEAWAPDLLIIDEAQRVKNWNTVAARALRRISAPHAIVLSGTPPENRLEELIAIVQLVDQHRLGPTWRLLHEHQQVDDSGRVVGYQALDRIGATLAPVMLRRRKAKVLAQLPDRLDKTLFVPLTPEQRVHHDENGEAVRRIVQRWRKSGYLSDADQHRLQCALQNMRMVCNSTWLLDRETDHGHKADELMLLLEELLADPSAKAVVFSQWRGTHEVLLRRLRQRGWGHVLFHGGVPTEQRGALVDRFHQDADCRLFLSTDAGGVGLNLQHAAATVVNLDLPWNPAVLEQRIGRVHRLGQQRGVQVINLVAEGSIEHGMLGVLAFKKSLFAGVLDGGDSAVFMQGTRLSKFMDSVEAVTGAVPPVVADGVADGVADMAGEAADPAPVAAVAAGVLRALAPEDAAHGAAPVTRERDAVPEPQPAASPADPLPTAAMAAAAAPPDPWAGLLDAGLAWLSALSQGGGAAAGTAAGPGGSGGLGGPAGVRLGVDPTSGRPVLQLPLPQPETLQRLLRVLEQLRAPR